MKKNVILTALALAMASLTVQALTYTTAAIPTGTGNWAVSTTWGGAASPGATIAGDIARITGGNTVTLNSTIPNTLGNVQIGRVTVGNLIVDSGANLTVLLGSNTEVGNTAVGTYTQNGGTCTEQSAFNISGQATTTAGSSATINGGNLNIGTALAVGKFANGTLTINGGSVLSRDYMSSRRPVAYTINHEGLLLDLAIVDSNELQLHEEIIPDQLEGLKQSIIRSVP